VRVSHNLVIAAVRAVNLDSIGKGIAMSPALTAVPAVSLSTPATPMTEKEMADRIAYLEARLAATKAASHKTLSFKVSEKGALSVYGLGRFPVTLYKGQWERLIEAIPQVKEFIKANEKDLAVKVP
jgi:hypothetical protein